ncbi:MAG: hypothetical protein TREMPRED_003288 [Tremellales sp. Tagirdzhanova-0007]|nr:MAG: hypothetical protein TREMPRED_003288 [Tremellales sp. Tagirdzhanova-0007]
MASAAYAEMDGPLFSSKPRKHWIQDQVRRTDEYLSGSQERRIETDIGAPSKENDGHFYYRYNNVGYKGTWDQDVIFRFDESALDHFGTSDMPMGEKFFDINELDSNGSYSIVTSSFSPVGDRWAYAVRTEQSWSTNGKNGEPEDIVTYVKHTDSIVWSSDGNGFFYQTFPIPPEDQVDPGTSTSPIFHAQLRYHLIGTSQSQDILVYDETETPNHHFRIARIMGGRYALLSIMRTLAREEKVKIVKLEIETSFAKDRLDWRWLITDWGAEYQVIFNVGDTVYVRTNKDADNFRIAHFDITQESVVLKDVVPEHVGQMMTMALPIKGNLMALVYHWELRDVIRIHDYQGHLTQEIDLRDLGSLKELICLDDRFILSTSSFLDHGSIYSAYLDNGHVDTPRRIRTGVKVEGVSVEKVRLLSFDVQFLGRPTPVGMDTLERRNFDTRYTSARALIQSRLVGTGTRLHLRFSQCISICATRIYVPLRNRWNPAWMLFVQRFKGVVALVSIRGGEELGHRWRVDGQRLNMHKGLDDLLSAMHWLVDNAYTSRGHIALHGLSNGGRIVACVTNQAEEGLIGCTVSDAGFHDAVNYPKFTSGRLWVHDYGDPDRPEDLQYMQKLSPLHNVTGKKRYPAMLITVADHDDRVVGCHSVKLTAALQTGPAENSGPFLFDLLRDSGHGHFFGEVIPRSRLIRLLTRRYAFVSRALGIPWSSSG